VKAVLRNGLLLNLLHVLLFQDESLARQKKLESDKQMLTTEVGTLQKNLNTEKGNLMIYASNCNDSNRKDSVLFNIWPQ